MPSKLERHAEQLSALGHPVRLAILRFVVQSGEGGAAAGDIQGRLEVPASTLSHHLERLVDAGLLSTRNEGTSTTTRQTARRCARSPTTSGSPTLPSAEGPGAMCPGTSRHRSPVRSQEWPAHVMFGEPIFFPSEHVRAGGAQLVSEVVATFGLLATIWGTVRTRPTAIPFAVGAYVTAGYWFTASTCFAHPAVTLARAASNTFAGIRPTDVGPFIAAQLAGAMAATVLFGWLVPVRRFQGDASSVANPAPHTQEDVA